jgi:hypothetical protein
MYPFGWSAGEVPPKVLSFRDFQDLPDLVHQGALIALQTRDDCQGAQHVIDNFGSYEGDLKIGDLIYLMDHTVGNPQMKTMLQCWVDHDQDMVRAKLAWSPGY